MNKSLDRNDLRQFVAEIAAEDLHAKTVCSIADGVLGVLQATVLSIHAIGIGLAKVASLNSKHAIKQVDRLLSNGLFNVWLLFEHWVPYVIGTTKSIVVALDWTEFDADNHATIALHLISSHGRTTPLIWLTVQKSNLRGKRNGYEDRVLARLREIVSSDIQVTILADRGFADQKLFKFLKDLKFNYVIRLRGGINVTNSEGETRTGKDWIPSNGRTVTLRHARVTDEHYEVGCFVGVKARGMKDSWSLASSFTDMPGPKIVRLYGRRFTIEESFRDTKDLRFGMGLSATHIGDVERRDRILLLSAMASMILTVLGAAGERIGMDRMLKANTVKRRSHSLFTQGRHYYEMIPTMKPDLLGRLVESFAGMLRVERFYVLAFGLLD